MEGGGELERDEWEKRRGKGKLKGKRILKEEGGTGSLEEKGRAGGRGVVLL